MVNRFEFVTNQSLEAQVGISRQLNLRLVIQLTTVESPSVHCKLLF